MLAAGELLFLRLLVGRLRSGDHLGMARQPSQLSLVCAQWRDLGLAGRFELIRDTSAHGLELEELEEGGDHPEATHQTRTDLGAIESCIFFLRFSIVRVRVSRLRKRKYVKG